MFEPTAGCSSGASAKAAASGSRMTGSGRYSTAIRSSASSARWRSCASTIATGSPTYRTRSTARHQCCIGVLTATANGFVQRRASSPVTTQATPGIASAADASIETNSAWPWGERRIAVCNTLRGSGRSSAKRPRPRNRSASSTRVGRCSGRESLLEAAGPVIGRPLSGHSQRLGKPPAAERGLAASRLQGGGDSNAQYSPFRFGRRVRAAAGRLGRKLGGAAAEQRSERGADSAADGARRPGDERRLDRAAERQARPLGWRYSSAGRRRSRDDTNSAAGRIEEHAGDPAAWLVRQQARDQSEIAPPG